jgi:hypothetical protein
MRGLCGKALQCQPSALKSIENAHHVPYPLFHEIPLLILAVFLFKSATTPDLAEKDLHRGCRRGHRVLESGARRAVKAERETMPRSQKKVIWKGPREDDRDNQFKP